MKDIYSGLLALDGGVLIGLNTEEPGFNNLKNSLLSGDSIAMTHQLAITEMLYIICRKSSIQTAKEKLNYLKLSGHIEIVNIEELIEEASELKCRRKISLPDCFTIALAKKYSGKAVFAHLEKEIRNELQGEPFDVDIIFALDKLMVEKGSKELKSL